MTSSSPQSYYVPAGAKEIIDIGQRVCDSSTMIEAALRLGLEELLGCGAFWATAGTALSLDRVFAREPAAEGGV